MKSDYRVKFSAVVFLVQIHAVRKHFFEITDLDGHVGGKFTAVYFNSSWVNIQVRPNPEVLNQILKAGSGLVMETFIFLHGVDF